MAARKKPGVGTEAPRGSKGTTTSARDGIGPKDATSPAPGPSRTHAPSATTPAGVMTEATARAAAAASPVRPAHQEIARRAYELWCAEGKPEGREREHWLAAERSLIVEVKPGAGVARR